MGDIDVRFEIALGAAPSDVDPVWTDVTEFVTDWHTNRGRSDEAARVEAGTGSITLENPDGQFTPGRSAVRPMCPVRIYAAGPYGSDMYPIFYGHVDDWPVDFYAGNELSTVTIDLVDEFESLGADAFGLFYEKLLNEQGPPTAYFPLTEGSDSVTAVNRAGTALLTDATLSVTPYGATSGDRELSASFGGDAPYMAQRTGSSLSLNAEAAGSLEGGGEGLDLLGGLTAGYGLEGRVRDPDIARSGNWSFSCWVRVAPDPAAEYNPILFLHGPASVPFAMTILLYPAEATLPLDGGDNALQFTVFSQMVPGAPTGYWAQGVNINNGEWRHLAARFYYYAPDDIWVLALYVDGDHKWFYQWAPDDPTLPFQLPVGPTFNLGQIHRTDGDFGTSGYYMNLAGDLSHFAWFSEDIGTAKILAQYEFGRSGWLSEDETTRIGRMLDWAGWPAERRDLDEGISSLLDSREGPDKSPLELIQAPAEDAGGVIYMAPDGDVRYRSRRSRLNATLAATFKASEGTEPDKGLRFSYGSKAIINSATTAQRDGVSYVYTDADSAAEFGPRAGPSRELAVTSVDEVRQTGEWEVNVHSQPLVRIESITLDPTTRPNLWPILRALDIGDKVALDELPLTAPADYMEFFVEKIDMKGVIDGEVHRVSVTLTLSPAEVYTAWQLEDPVYGSLDGPGRLSY